MHIIAVDFDGTLCENAWPEIGETQAEVIDYLLGQHVFSGRNSSDFLISNTVISVEKLIRKSPLDVHTAVTSVCYNRSLPHRRHPALIPAARGKDDRL